MNRILIVDDKPENLYLLRVLLQANDFVVDEANHGAEALTIAHRQRPDLLISDLLMPVMDGYTLLRHWKNDPALGTVPFLVYTATYTEPQDEKLAMDMGADAFVLKPVEPDELLARVRRLLTTPRGESRPSVRPVAGDPEVNLRQYNEVLIRKLEDKARELEQANESLRLDLQQRQQAENEANRLRETAERSQRAMLGILEEHRRSETKLKEQVEELRRWHEATLGREQRVMDLKREVNELLVQTGKNPRYPSATGGQGAGPL